MHKTDPQLRLILNSENLKIATKKWTSDSLQYPTYYRTLLLFSAEDIYIIFNQNDKMNVDFGVTKNINNVTLSSGV